MSLVGFLRSGNRVGVSTGEEGHSGEEEEDRTSEGS